MPRHAGSQDREQMQGAKARWLAPAAVPGGYDAPLKHLSSVVAQVLFNRGITPDELPRFLRPDVADMHTPWLLRGMKEAVGRIRQAIAAGEKIAVYGDFDVDGIAGTVLLHEIFVALGADSTYYVPHRRSEGYGLNRSALDVLREQGVRLVVTVDCGIGSAAEIDYARDTGIDVIVTDHHLPPLRLPNASAVINPNQPLCSYPFKGLCGAGVAFKLASALVEGRPDGHRLRHDVLDLVVIATVSDMVPLRGENRILVRYGLPVLTHTGRPGLRALLRRADLDHADVTAGDISFRVGPRLNAAGRVDHAMVGCELLITRDHERADELAEILESKNIERQQLTTRVIEEAREIIGPAPPAHALLVDDPGWPGGVIGLVAGRLAEEYCRPVFVVERGEDESKGSARSIPGFNVIEALMQCEDLLTKFGGHAQAAGFTLRTDAIGPLRARLAALAAESLSDADFVPSIQIDAEIGGRDLDGPALMTLYEQLAELEPFGTGNLPPVLLWRTLRVAECRVVGGRHVRLSLATPGGSVSAIAFGRAGDLGALPRGTAIDVVCNVQYNDWNGYPVAELRVKDVALKGDIARSAHKAPQASPA